MQNFPRKFDGGTFSHYTVSMIIIQKDAGDISSIIKEHLAAKKNRSEQPLFVFSSDVAADSWTEWAVRNPEESGAEAVALEDFTAWDKFKGAYLASGVEGKACIPSLLRKMFVQNLIRQNRDERWITKIIPVDDVEAAYAFTDWIAKILPSLKLWHEKYMAYRSQAAGMKQDDEDADYNALYTHYWDFLDKNNFFEPAWLTPEFIEQKRTVIVFYPELLEDFADYEPIFENADNVIAVTLPEADAAARPSAWKFNDSRSELRRTMLRLRALHESGVPWTDIALSVPDMETYRPYIKREAARYCVPVNIRSGEPLTKNCAGLIFRQMQDCFANKFSYDSVRALLQNEYVPWNDDAREKKEKLVREGSRLRALCGYEELNGDRQIDSWESALQNVPGDKDILEFYQHLKRDVVSLCRADSFDNVLTAWILFKTHCLRSDEFTDTANKILGRCISELNNLIDIEREHAVPLGLAVQNPFSFYLGELEAKTYRPQESLDGVSVFPYKLSAAAAIPHQFVIDASQSNLDIPYRKLAFLNADKRRRLLGEDAEGKGNSSTAFVRLYAKNAGKDDIVFSYAEDSFAGFAIAHNALAVVDLPKGRTPCDELDETDFYVREGLCVRERQQEDACSGQADSAAILSRPRTGPCVRDWRGGGAVPERPGRGGMERERNPGKPGGADFGSAADETREVSAGERRTPEITETQKNAFLDWAERTGRFEEKLPYSVGEKLRERIDQVTAGFRKSDCTVVTQTDLSQFYPCPRRWIFGSVLKLKEDSLDTSLMQPYDMGNINHKVLELYMKGLIEANECLPTVNGDGVFDDEDAIFARIHAYTVNAIHDRAMDFRDSSLVIEALESQTDAIARGIMDFLHYICLAPNKPAPEAINTKTSISGFGGYRVRGAELEKNAVNEAGTKLFGKIDCLLQNDEGDFVIVDYKNTNGAMPKAGAIRPDENGLLGDFQMPMYVSLVQDGRMKKHEVCVEAAYFYAIKDRSRTCAVDNYSGLSKADKDAKLRNPKHADTFCEETVGLFNAYVSDFTERIRKGKFEPVKPKKRQGAFVYVEPYTVCTGCSFKGICRTTFTVGEKKQ